jgi:hypothetical protein
VSGKNQSNIWSGFRIAQKAKVLLLKEGLKEITLEHDGYKRLKASHKRSFFWNEKSILIKDFVSGSEQCIAYFHFHPSIVLSKDGSKIKADDFLLDFHFAESIKIEDYEFAIGFNKRVGAKRICVSFANKLETKIIF